MGRTYKHLPKLSAPQDMDSPEREYFRMIRIYQRALVDLLESGLRELIPRLKEQALKDTPAPLRTDSVSRMDVNIESELKKLFESVQRRVMKLYPTDTLKTWATRMTSHVNDVNKKNVAKAVGSIGVDIEPLFKDKQLNPFFQNIVEENVGLIRSIGQSQLPALKNALVAAITADQPQDQIRETIEKKFSATTSQARLIARDQVNKLNGRLNQYRQTQIGGKRYVWRTSDDERVREDHKKLDGKTFSWDKPPIVDRKTGTRGHPGSDFQCRCVAEMVLEDIIDQPDEDKRGSVWPSLAALAAAKKLHEKLVE